MGVLVPLSPQADSEAAGVEWYDSGIGFAVSLEDILRVLPRLKEGKDLRPGKAGVTFTTRDPNAKLPAIDRVRYDGPAWQATPSARRPDQQIDGKPIERMAQLPSVLKSRLEGEMLTVTVKRGEEESHPLADAGRRSAAARIRLDPARTIVRGDGGRESALCF